MESFVKKRKNMPMRPARSQYQIKAFRLPPLFLSVKDQSQFTRKRISTKVALPISVFGRTDDELLQYAFSA
ncbi:MAG: hypothetical protein P8I81_02695, partial [Pseudomonadales bacterium]|nr:hypothetical protein [Pseudomonadales bacterium]